MQTLYQIPLIQVLTRPAMVFGLTYNYFALMLVVCLSVTFITKWYAFTFFLAVCLFMAGRWVAAHDPQWLDGFLVFRQRCKFQKNQKYWSCRSYAPW